MWHVTVDTWQVGGGEPSLKILALKFLQFGLEGVFAGPKRGWPTPGLSIFIRSFNHSIVRLLRSKLTLTHLLNLRSPIIDDPHLPKPTYGGAKVFLVGHDWLTILILIESNNCGKLLTYNIMLVKNYAFFHKAKSPVKIIKNWKKKEIMSKIS